jgi:hypothetical protein
MEVGSEKNRTRRPQFDFLVLLFQDHRMGKRKGYKSLVLITILLLTSALGNLQSLC